MQHNISGEEWRVMQVLWERGENMTSAEIVAALGEGRSPRTVKTYLQRLVSKGFVNYIVDASDSRVYHYFPVVSEEDCIDKENLDFVSLYYKGDVGSLLWRFIGDSELSPDQIQKLSALLESKKKDAQIE